MIDPSGVPTAHIAAVHHHHAGPGSWPRPGHGSHGLGWHAQLGVQLLDLGGSGRATASRLDRVRRTERPGAGARWRGPSATAAGAAAGSLARLAVQQMAPAPESLHLVTRRLISSSAHLSELQAVRPCSRSCSHGGRARSSWNTTRYSPSRSLICCRSAGRRRILRGRVMRSRVDLPQPRGRPVR